MGSKKNLINIFLCLLTTGCIVTTYFKTFFTLLSINNNIFFSYFTYDTYIQNNLISQISYFSSESEYKLLGSFILLTFITSIILIISCILCIIAKIVENNFELYFRQLISLNRTMFILSLSMGIVISLDITAFSLVFYFKETSYTKVSFWNFYLYLTADVFQYVVAYMFFSDLKFIEKCKKKFDEKEDDLIESEIFGEE